MFYKQDLATACGTSQLPFLRQLAFYASAQRSGAEGQSQRSGNALHAGQRAYVEARLVIEKRTGRSLSWIAILQVHAVDWQTKYSSKQRPEFDPDPAPVPGTPFAICHWTESANSFAFRVNDSDTSIESTRTSSSCSRRPGDCAQRAFADAVSTGCCNDCGAIDIERSGDCVFTPPTGCHTARDGADCLSAPFDRKANQRDFQVYPLRRTLVPVAVLGPSLWGRTALNAVRGVVAIVIS